MAEDTATMTVPTEAAAPADASPTPATEPATSDGVQEQPASSGDAATSETAQTDVAQPKPDYRKQYQSEPEFRAFVKAEADRLAQQRLDRERKKDKLQRAKEDPAAALEYVQGEVMTAEEEEARDAERQSKFTKAHGNLQDLWKSKEWASVYNELRASEGAKFHEAWANDPQGFVDALDDRITDILIDRRAGVKAKAMAEAMALEESNKRLSSLPVPPTGSGGAGGVPTLAEIENMSAAEWKQHRERVLASLDQYRR